MSRLVESIKVIDGKLLNMNYHISRINHTRKSLFNASYPLDLSLVYELAEYCKTGTYKCRVLYHELIEEISFDIYFPKSINSLKVVRGDKISYEFKFENRSNINLLSSKRNGADDIIIIKNGLLTDSSYCNIALYKSPYWYTPKTPLLKGTKRAALIEKGIIIEKDIAVENIFDYSRLCLFNAMIDFNSIVLEINNIKL